MRSSWDACKALLLFFAISCVVAPSLGQSSRSLKISGEDVDAQLKKLSLLSDDPAPAVTRILFTEHDVLARKYVEVRQGVDV